MGKSLVTPLKEKIQKLNPWAKKKEEIVETDNDEELPLRIVERKEWCLKKPKWRQRLKTPVDLYVLRYFTGTPDCEGDEKCFKVLRKMQAAHMDVGMPDIAYNFLIGMDGTVYEGRGWSTKSTKEDYNTLKYHGKSLDIAYIGDFLDIHPPDEMTEAACRLMQRGVKLGYAELGWDLVEVKNESPHTLWNREEFDVDDGDEKIYDELENKDRS